MKRAFRIVRRIVGVLGLLAAVILALYVFWLPGYVESRIRSALAEAGLPDAGLRLRGLSFRGVQLADLSLDREGRLTASAVDVEFDLGALRAGRVKTIRVTGLTFHVRVSDGKLDLGPLDDIRTEGSSDAGDELPFERLELRAATLLLDREGVTERFHLDAVATPRGVDEVAVEASSRLLDAPLTLSGWVRTSDGAGQGRATLGGLAVAVKHEPERGRLHLEIDGARESLEVRSGDRRVKARRVEARGRIVLEDLERVAEAELSIAFGRLHVDDLGLGPLWIEISGDGGPLTFEASGRFRDIRLVRATAETPATLDFWRDPKLAIPVSWSVRGDPADAGIDLHASGRLTSRGEAILRRTDGTWEADLQDVHVLLVDGVTPAFPGSLRGRLQVEGKIREDGLSLTLLEGTASIFHPDLDLSLHAELSEPGSVVTSFDAEPDWRLDLPAVRFESPPTDLTDAAAVVEAKGLRSRLLLAVGGRSGRLQAQVREGSRIEADLLVLGSGEGAVRIPEVSLAATGLAELLAARFTGRISAERALVAEGAGLRTEIEEIEFEGTVAEEGIAEGRLGAVVSRLDYDEFRTSGLRLLLPVTFGGDRPAETGALQIESVEWRGHEFPGPTAALRQEGTELGLDLTWVPTPTAVIALIGSVDFSAGNPSGELEITARPFRLDPEDRFGRLASDLFGLRVSGWCAPSGKLGLVLGRLVPRLRLGLTGGTVATLEDTQRLEGVSAELGLSGVDPLSTPGGQRVRWSKGRFGEFELGPGVLEFRVESPDSILVERAAFRVSDKGRFWAHSFRLDPTAPDLRFELFCEDVSLGGWLDLIASDEATGEGRLYGRLPVRIRLEPQLRISLGEGFLYAQAPGHFEVLETETLEQVIDRNLPNLVGDPNLDEQVREQVRNRMVHSLRDFGFSVLRFDVIENRRGQTLRVRAAGKGRRVPQEIDLTVNFNGFDNLIAMALAVKLGLEKAGARIR